MHLLRSRIARGLVVGGVIALVGLPAVTANASQTNGPRIVSDAGDSIVSSAAESSAPGGAPATGRGVTSANTAASAADLAPATGAGGGLAGGRPIAESVIAPDKRTQITATTTFPNRAVVYMTFTEPGVSGTVSCTGFFVGPDTIATAGHCVHKGSGGSNGYHNRTSFRIYPGRNGATIPYKCSNGAIVTAKKLWTNSSWTNGGGETVDYGAVEINPCSNGVKMGNTVGWFGYTNTQGTSQNGLADYMQGYPADKPTGTQWAANNCSTNATVVQCTIQSTTTHQLFYKNDTSGGQSGSPVFRKRSNCNPCAIAIHAYGLHGSGLHATYNHGTRIENNVATFLNNVKAA
jgi:glutamyl endopeptidase